MVGFVQLWAGTPLAHPVHVDADDGVFLFTLDIKDEVRGYPFLVSQEGEGSVEKRNSFVFY